ncbi:uncharacterized protein LOC116112737 isoform X1 [Pistacia vera]|uniref:uncharacterized protein LOC116112737 isoform X1 n=1 Tax=Pistacia vera TaxID=55513 RepID=UPI00126363B4|nr:uncharacterized protein LOC116112737 isoform X1 [Pistacia vera]
MTMQISLKDSGVHAESVEYAKAPSTPGLVQEPNLPCVQEALACDDHLESEDRNSNELVAAVSTMNPLSKLDWSLQNNSNCDIVQCTLPQENGHHVRDLEVKQAKPLGKLCQFDAYDIKVFRGHQMVQTE